MEVHSKLAVAVRRAREALAEDYAGGAFLSLSQAYTWFGRAETAAVYGGAATSFAHFWKRRDLVERVLDNARCRLVEKWARTSPKRGRPAKVRTSEVRHA